MDDLARHLDFANHHANATPDDIRTLCLDVVTYDFHAAFVNPIHVALAVETLGGRAPVGTVISFPLGGDTKEQKMAATNNAVSLGASELDVVPAIGLYLSGDTNAFLAELRDVVESARMLKPSTIVKFILDPGYFDALEDPKSSLMRAAEMVRASGADFVKIGSGMGPRNPEIKDLQAVREAVGKTMKIKVAGGVSDRKTAASFIAAGADRIGTSHAKIIIGAKPEITPPSKKNSSEE